MIVELVKAAAFIFPFIKELFLGKDKKDDAAKDKDPKASPPEKGSKGHALRQIVIAVGVLSGIVNFVLVEKIFTMASSMVSLKREVTTLRANGQDRSTRQSDDQNRPTPQAVEQRTRQPEPLPTPQPPEYPPQVVTPPREDHLEQPVRRSTGRSGRQSDSSVVDRSDSLHRRLRSIDDIK